MAFHPLWDLFKEFGSYRVKHAMAERSDFAQIEPPRPVSPSSEAAHNRVAKALRYLDEVVGGMERTSGR